MYRALQAKYEISLDEMSQQPIWRLMRALEMKEYERDRLFCDEGMDLFEEATRDETDNSIE